MQNKGNRSLNSATNHQSLVCILSQPIAKLVTLGKSLNFSVLQFPYLENGITILPHRVSLRMK